QQQIRAFRRIFYADFALGRLRGLSRAAFGILGTVIDKADIWRERGRDTAIGHHPAAPVIAEREAPGPACIGLAALVAVRRGRGGFDMIPARTGKGLPVAPAYLVVQVNP